MKRYSLGIIGCGNMAKAILRALVSETVVYLMKQNGIRISLSVSDTDNEKFDDIDCRRITTYTDNSELVAASDIVLLAVKPQAAQTALDGIDFGDKIVMSIMAGVNLKRLKSMISGAVNKFVRVMPNLNARYGCSVNAYCCDGLSEEEEEVVLNILGAFGRAYKVDECFMNSVTGISGSGPAFCFMFIDAFIQKAVSCGFGREVSKELVLDTLYGCLENVRNYDGDISELVDSVCSKGGTTIEGVNYLKKADFENAVKQAITKSEKRSEELEKNI